MKRYTILLVIGLVSVTNSFANCDSNTNDICIHNGVTYLPVKRVSSLDKLNEKDKFLLDSNETVKTGEVIDRRVGMEVTSLEKIELPRIEDIKTKTDIEKEVYVETPSMENKNEVDYTKNPPAMFLHSKDIDIFKEDNKNPLVAKKKVNDVVIKDEKKDVKSTSSVVKKIQQKNEAKSVETTIKQKNSKVSTKKNSPKVSSKDKGKSEDRQNIENKKLVNKDVKKLNKTVGLTPKKESTIKKTEKKQKK